MFICEAYLPQQPGHMSGHIVYAQTLFEMGRYDDSKAAFGTALALDPENLIALRHLGDIARHAGDLNTAREWYQRVLEADPRNEEIVEVMASLRQAQTGGAAPASPMAPATPAEVPSSMPTPAMSTEPPAPSSPTPVASAPATPPTDDDFEEDELLDLDLDAMVIGETPLSTPAVSSTETPANDDAAFESDPLAIAATEPPTSSSRPTFVSVSSTTGRNRMSRRLQIQPPLEGLRSYEPGIIPERTEIVDTSLEMEPFYDILHGEATPTSTRSRRPSTRLSGVPKTLRPRPSSQGTHRSTPAVLIAVGARADSARRRRDLRHRDDGRAVSPTGPSRLGARYLSKAARAATGRRRVGRARPSRRSASVWSFR